jgi:hypothetical protein
MDGQFAKRVPRGPRWLALACALVIVICMLGCMSFNFGRVETVQPADATVQTGSVTIPAHQTLDIFYPSPYVVTPNLVVENSWNDCKVVEQKPNQFRINNPGPFAREISWKARGEKVPSELLLQTAKATFGTPAEQAPAVVTAGGVER